MDRKAGKGMDKGKESRGCRISEMQYLVHNRENLWS